MPEDNKRRGGKVTGGVLVVLFLATVWLVWRVEHVAARVSDLEWSVEYLHAHDRTHENDHRRQVDTALRDLRASVRDLERRTD